MATPHTCTNCSCVTEAGAAQTGWHGRVRPSASNKSVIARVVSGKVAVSLLANGYIEVAQVADTGPSPLCTMHPSFEGPSEAASDFWKISLNTSASPERIYGLGQLEGTASHGGCPIDGHQVGLPLERNGGSFSLSTSKFHVSVPFVTSSLGYAVFVNHPGSGTVAIGQHGGSTWTLDAQLQLDLWVSASPSPAALHARYADATGHATPLPELAAGFWQSRLRYRTSGEAEQVAARMAAKGLSVGVFVIDFFNQKTDGDFQMNPVCYPNVTALVQNIRESVNATLMVSLWTDIQPQSRSHNALASAGCLTGRDVEPTSAKCRRVLWRDWIKPNYFDQGARTAAFAVPTPCIRGLFTLDDTLSRARDRGESILVRRNRFHEARAELRTHRVLWPHVAHRLDANVRRRVSCGA